VNNGGGSIDCTRCPDGQVQSLDGFSCVECFGDCLRCQNNSYLTDTFSNGTLLSAGRECVFCDTKDSVLSGNSCKSCKPLLYSQSNTIEIKDAECNDNSFVTLGGLIFTETTYAGEPNYFNYFYDTNIGVSWYFLEYLKAAYRQCKTPTNRNQTACQNLANMCVLNLYLSPTNNNPTLPLLDSCLTFNLLYNDQITNNDQTRMPWLVYTNNFDELKSSYLQTGINTEYLAIKFGNSLSSQLQFYAASYELSGKFLSLEPIDISKLNLCYLESPFTSSIKNLSPFTTTNLYQSCSIRVSDLLKSFDNKVQIFYDLYVRYGNGTNLYPVPVKLSTNNDNYQKNDEFSIQRRFFLADVVSTKNNIDQPSVYIRYAKSIKLRIDLINEKSNGEIYPPILFIEYAYALRTNENQSITFKFEAEYKMDINTQYLVLFICVGVLSGLAFIWSCIRIWIWNRRSGRFALDIISLFKFFMFLLGSVGSCLFYTVVGWSLYWLCFYRGQSVAFIFLPIESQETIFNLFIIIGFILKLIDVLYLIFVQTSYDIFFIDWERPRAYDSGRDLLKSQKQTRLPPIEQQKDKFLESYKLDTEKETTKEIFKQTNVSCWRTLFVANEWNELQTYR
jgi:meckelin